MPARIKQPALGDGLEIGSCFKHHRLVGLARGLIEFGEKAQRNVTVTIRSGVLGTRNKRRKQAKRANKQAK